MIYCGLAGGHILRGVFKMSKTTWLLLSVVLVSAFAVLLRNEYRKRLPEIPDRIIVGTCADFPPFTFKQGDQFTGFDIDLITEVARRLNKPITFQNMPFELLIPQLQHGDVHVVAAGITPMIDRSKIVIFSQSYITKDPLVIMTLSKRPPITGFGDLLDKKIIVNVGYNADAYLSKMSNLTLVRLPTIADAVTALLQGGGDAFVTSLNTIRVIFDQYGKENFNLMTIEDVDEEIAFGVCPQYPKLRDAINDVLKELGQDGTIESLKTKWRVQ